MAVVPGQLSELLAKAREQEEDLKVQLARQQGRIEGLQEALSLAGVAALCVDAPVAPVVEKTPAAPTREPKQRRKLPVVGRPSSDGLTRQQRQDKIAESLANGPMSGAAIARATGIPHNSLDKIMQADSRFERNPQTYLWQLTGQPESANPKPAATPAPKPVSKPKPISENTRAYRRHKIAQTLSARRLILVELARQIDVPWNEVEDMLHNDPWFAQDKEGWWHITPQCRNEFFDE